MKRWTRTIGGSRLPGIHIPLSSRLLRRPDGM